MTEETWHRATELDSLLDYLYVQRGPEDRKLRLLCCAFCRRQLQHVKTAGIKHLLLRIESFVDNEISLEELQATRRHVQRRSASLWNFREEPEATVSYAMLQLACRFQTDLSDPADLWEYDDEAEDYYSLAELQFEGHEPYPLQVARTISDSVDSDVETSQGWSFERDQQLLLVRDIFGNPYRHEAIDPCWLSSTVLDLARTIYDEHAFERMPILADALMDAGCDSEEVINHCRSDGPHVRGCWIVDLLTGRA